MKKLLVASNNAHKLSEIRQILSDRFEVVSLKEAGVSVDPEETGSTFEDNALIKAKAVYEVSGMYALSDDSGLCVNCLGGAPGVYSARYAGEKASDADNNKLLLENMRNAEDRSAKFVCSVVLYFGDNNFISGYGETNGIILEKQKGSNGFGYDPLFLSDEIGKTFAEATADEKNAVSHRRRALEDIVSKLEKLISEFDSD